MARTSFVSLYGHRPLSEGYPDLEKLGADHYTAHQHVDSKIDRVFECLGRLIDLERSSRSVAVVGCGPNPGTVKRLLELGYDAVGVEPVPGSVEAARAFLGDPRRVVRGTAERIPLPDASQRVVVLECVIEHVDSPIASIAEACRVLMPGGVLYLTTNNRYATRCHEFTPRFFHFYPAVVRESYVFRHLHYDPALAQYTPRPAVHWFSYPELCRLGREGGFAQFYSPFDLYTPSSPQIRKSLLRRVALGLIQQNAWVRAAALTLFGGAIIMYKRPGEPLVEPRSRSAVG